MGMFKKLAELAPKRMERVTGRMAHSVGTAAQVWREARAAAVERGLSTGRLLRDVLVFRAVHSFGMLSYLQYRLWRPGLTREEKLQYLHNREMRARLWSLLTPPRYRVLYDNKLVSHRFFGSLGLPMAEIYGVYDPAVGHTMDGRPLRTAAELRGWLTSFQGEGFVFKPAEGGQW